MEKLKVGIAGIGNMGSSHARKIFEGKIPDMELCAVADKKEERRSWAKECFGNISVYCDVLDMLKHADIDADESHSFRGSGAVELPAAGLGILNYDLYMKLLGKFHPNIPLIIEHLDEGDIPRAKAFVEKALKRQGV